MIDFQQFQFFVPFQYLVQPDVLSPEKTWTFSSQLDSERDGLAGDSREFFGMMNVMEWFYGMTDESEPF